MSPDSAVTWRAQNKKEIKFCIIPFCPGNPLEHSRFCRDLAGSDENLTNLIQTQSYVHLYLHKYQQ